MTTAERLLVAALCAAASLSTASSFVFHPKSCDVNHGVLSMSLGDKASDSGAQSQSADTMSRRDAISTSGAALASVLLGSAISPLPASAAPPDFGTDKRTIVLTGSNSGIGYDAAARMAARGHRIVLACRTLAKATDAADRIHAALADSGATDAADLIPAECDLSSLDSIRTFASSIKPVVEKSGGIDALCLNAGLARNTEAKDVLRTGEGFELTVGVNHFGHFYLNHLLLPSVKKRTGRVVVTASSVHDPQSPGGAQGVPATLGKLSGLESGPNFDMVDGGPFNADKAYKDSKLCNVLFTRELQRRLDETGTGVVANCFTPGLIVGTGFFRDQNPVFTKVFDFAATSLLKVGETPHWGGGSLEYVTLDKAVGSKGGLYYGSPAGSSKYGDAAFGEQFTVDGISTEAKDDDKAKRLWVLSEKLVGISG